MKSTRPVWPIAILCCLLWGSAAAVIKLGFSIFGITNTDIPSVLLFAGARFFGAGVAVLVICSFLSRKLLLPRSGRGWRNAFLLGLVQTFLQYSLNFTGVASSSGIVSSVMNGTGSLFAILLSCSLFRQERMTLRKGVGAALGLSGILVMNLGAASGGFALLGAGLLLAASLSGSVGTCLSKEFARTEDPVVLAAWQQLFGGAMLLIVARLSGGRLTPSSPSGWAVLLYLIGVSAVSYSLWNSLLKKHPVSSVSVYGFLIPLFGVIISAVMLGEKAQALRPQTWLALGLVCCGIILVTGERANRKTRNP